MGSRAHAKKDGDGRWEKTNTPLTPFEDDYLDAKICTEVDQGKKPFAAFWQIIRNAADDIDDGGGGFEIFDNDGDDDIDGPPCDFCSCSPCRCEPEF